MGPGGGAVVLTGLPVFLGRPRLPVVAGLSCKASPTIWLFQNAVGLQHASADKQCRQQQHACRTAEPLKINAKELGDELHSR